MKIVSSARMRELDRRTISEHGTPGQVLMERAGRGVARIAARLAEQCPRENGPVLLAAGRGNNGGDAFVAARRLAEAGFAVDLRLAARAKDVRGDARIHLERMTRVGVPLTECPDEADWRCPAPCEQARPSLVVDGILGTGINGPARGAAAAAIRLVNDLGRRSPVLAIDVPSGLDADSGEAAGDTVRADVTATMGLPKLGLVQDAAMDCTGSIEVIDIGIPDAYLAGIDSDLELITQRDVLPALARRPRDAHKGCYGHVLLLAGADGYAGAAAMAALAAARGGAGLVTALVPRCIAPAVLALAPEAMVHGAAATDTGSLSLDGLQAWSGQLQAFDAIVAGPGMTPHAETRRVVEHVLAKAACPVVLDADALNVLAGCTDPVGTCAAPVVLTPHPGEMARLTGLSSAAVQADRAGTAQGLADSLGAVVVLKGAGTLVAEKRHTLHINMTGNPGMATGGMGDVLTGLLAALLARGLSAGAAARAAVFLHGRAGDLAAGVGSEESLIATDVLAALPAVFREIAGR